MQLPLISVITVTYNAVKTVENTLLSVLSQTFTDYEFIIVDGDSTDGTLEVLNKYRSHITHIVSEKDSGIYDAMNKAVALSAGNYIYFLGADDILKDVNIFDLLKPDLLTGGYDLIAGAVIYNTGRRFQSAFSFKTLLNNTIHHQAAFYNKALFLNFKYDTNFRFIADYELNLRFYLNRSIYKYKISDEVISICTEGGASRSELSQAYNETNGIRFKVLGKKATILKYLYSLKFYITKYVI